MFCDSNNDLSNVLHPSKNILEGDLMLNGMSEKQEKFVRDAIDLQLKVLKTKAFKEDFLKMKWTQTNGKTNEELWKELMTGRSTLSKKKDFDLDYFITLYSGKKKTVGYTLMRSGKIFVNKTWFNKWVLQGKKGQAYLSAHLFHEYLHSCGYTHKGFGYIKRKSFVYKCGYLLREHALNLAS